MSANQQKKKKLPVLGEDAASSLRSDGSHNRVYPADVSGRFTRTRTILFFVFIAIYALLPWIEIGGHPSVFLDIEHRRFFLFGAAFNSQDVWLVFFLLSGLGFALFVITTLFGRIWCGYACPQTVFLEGLFRRIERLVEGPRSVRMRRDKGPPTREKLIRKTISHTLYVLAALAVAHIFLSYFVSLPRLWDMIGEGPGAHPFAFGWIVVTTAVMVGNFVWFREQLCLVICPYGRLQSVMTDDDTMVIGYDTTRGEPRGKKSDPDAGDCVDCKRCVTVCPTGIDIRNGLQIDCIGCAACVDACDEIMTKLGRDKGLVRYDSLRGLDGKKKRFFRPRLVLYAVMGIAGLVAATLAFRSHVPVEATLLRTQGAPYEREGDELRNSYELSVANKGGDAMKVKLSGVNEPGKVPIRYVISEEEFDLPAGDIKRVAVFAYIPLEPVEGKSRPKQAKVVVERSDGEGQWTATSRFLTPR